MWVLGWFGVDCIFFRFLFGIVCVVFFGIFITFVWNGSWEVFECYDEGRFDIGFYMVFCL